jgi:hypothetical protein
MSNRIVDLYPGGNTYQGFYSFYRYIMPQTEARRIFCIKGGPGTGKSSLMKKIATYFSKKGYDVELHHCSSDNNSLDGIVIKGLNVAILDGTAPHIVDPINPGAVDEVINMGDYWNEAGFGKFRDKIIKINLEVGKTFKRAYRFIAAAKNIHDDWASYNLEAKDQPSINKLKEDLKKEILVDDDYSKVGKERHLFVTALTPNGIVSFIEPNIKDYEKIIILKGGPGVGKTEVLDYLAKEAIKRGYDVTIFHDPLTIDRIEHIIIPTLKTAVITSNELANTSIEGKEIDMEKLLNQGLLKENEEEIAKDKELFYSLLTKGLNTIKYAKALHDEMETYYVPNMNFDEISGLYERLISRIEGYEKEIK